MELLSYLGQIVIYFIVLVILYFSFDKLMQSKLYLNFRIPKRLNYLIFGLILGLFNLLASHSMTVIGNLEDPPIYFFLTLILVFFKSYQCALYSMGPLAIYNAIKYEIDEIFYFNMAISFLIILIVQILKNFYTKEKVAFGVFSVIFVVILISVPLNIMVFEKNNFRDNITNTTYALFINLILFFIFYYLMNFSISSNLLYASSNFTFMRYYRSGIARPVISRFIQEERIQYGTLNVIEFNFVKQKNIQDEKEIRLSILEAISKMLPEKAVLFNLIQETYGFFLPFEEIDHKIEARMTRIIKKIPKIYRLSNKKIVRVQTKVGIATYGINSNEINTLVNYAIFALNTIPNHTNINFFNPRLWLKNEKETILLNELDNTFALDDFTNNFTNLWSVNKLQSVGYWVDQDNIAQYSLQESIDDLIYYQNWQQIFYRYFANEAIGAVKKNRLFFSYDLSIFEDSFDTENFLYQLEKEKIKFHNVFLVISEFSFDKLRNWELVKDVVTKLQEKGINFVISNNSPPLAKKIFSKIKYSYVQNKFEKKKYPTSILISPLINDLEMLKDHIAKGANVIGGPFILKKNSVANFDKQSKIYLEKVLKRLNHE